MANDRNKVIQMPNITKNKKATKGRELVYQGNPLIQSRKYFNTIGTRLFILGLMSLNPHLSKRDKFYDKEFPLVHISTSELVKVFGNTFYLKDLKAECDKLFNSHLTLDYKNGGFKLMHIFDVMEYLPNDGLYIQFDPKMKDYLLELVNGGYTAINIEQLFKLTSTYAVRLIELCMQYRNMIQGNTITREFSMEELRFFLNVPDDAYVGRLDHFKEKVLDEPIYEIAKKTDFRMGYSTRREGRRIKYFTLELDIANVPPETFNIKPDYDKKLPVASPYSDVIGELINQGFSRKAATDILGEVNDTVEVGLRLEYALKILPEYNKKRSINNKQGFLRKAILEDWRKNDVKSKNKMNISAASKVKNNMQLNALNFEKARLQQQVNDANHAMEKTGITQADLQDGESPIPHGMMLAIQKDILADKLSDSSKSVLKAFNFTPERFKQVYMTNGVIESENAFVGKIGGFNGIGNILPIFR